MRGPGPPRTNLVQIYMKLEEQAMHGLWSLAGLQRPCSRPPLSADDLDELSRSGWPSFWCAIRVRQWVPTDVCACKITSLCVYSGYNLCHPGCPKIDSYIFTPVKLKSTSNPMLYSTSMLQLHVPMMQIWWPQRYCTWVFLWTPETDESRLLWPTFCVWSGFASGSSQARI